MCLILSDDDDDDDDDAAADDDHVMAKRAIHMVNAILWSMKHKYDYDEFSL